MRQSRDESVSKRDLEFMLGLVVWALSTEIQQAKDALMATLEQVLADEVQEGGEITQLVAILQDQVTLIDALKAQIAALQPGVLTAEQQAQIDGIFAQAELNKAAVEAALPAPAPTPDPTPDPTAFVVKLADEVYTDYRGRVDQFNLANPDAQMTALDEATWTGLPVG